MHEIAHGADAAARAHPAADVAATGRALLRSYAAHEEGGDRVWELETIGFEGEDGRLRACERGGWRSPATPRPASARRPSPSTAAR